MSVQPAQHPQAAAPALGWRLRWRWLGVTYVRRDDGVVAVEFGLIALPLFMLILGIIEVAMFFTAGLVLEGASAEAGRLIRTGQAQLSADPEDAFETELCDSSDMVLDCDLLQYEVLRIETGNFADAEGNMPTFDGNGNLEPSGFNAGDSNDVIMIRTVYRYEFVMPFMGALITGDPDRNWATHMATVVIKSEPYLFGQE